MKSEEHSTLHYFFLSKMDEKIYAHPLLKLFFFTLQEPWCLMQS